MVKLIKSDAIELLKSLEDNSVKAIIQDMPYGGTLVANSGNINVADISKFDEKFFDNFFKEARRVLRKDGYLASTTNYNFLTDFLFYAKKHNLPVVKNIVLVYNSVSLFLFSKGEKMFSNFVLLPILGDTLKSERISRLKKYFEDGVVRTVWVMPSHLSSNIRYPGKQPLEPFIMLVELLTDEGDLVVDPFCGSGTTGEACLLLGRRFIGGDIDEKALELAKIRLSAYDFTRET